jgi:hypothetical protein
MTSPQLQVKSPAMASLWTPLPYELISYIFLCCLPLDRRVRPSRSTPPLLLAQICRQWRVVALSTPQLWNSIFLPHDYFPALSDPEPVVNPATALMGSWFSRSQGYPLSVALSCDYRRRLPGRVIALLKNTSTQWERLELRLSRHDLLELMNVPGPFPLLRSLAMDPSDGLGHNFNWPTGLYPDLSALRLGFSVTMSFPDTAFTRLTALEFWMNDLTLAVVVADRFPHLLHLVIHIFPSFQPLVPAALPIPVTVRLRTLIGGSMNFLACVTIPLSSISGRPSTTLRGPRQSCHSCRALGAF